MEMDGGAVLCVIFSSSIGTLPRPHIGSVHRYKEVASDTRGKLVDELDSHRLVSLGNYQGPQIMDRCYGHTVDLHITSQCGRRKV